MIFFFLNNWYKLSIICFTEVLNPLFYICQHSCFLFVSNSTVFVYVPCILQPQFNHSINWLVDFFSQHFKYFISLPSRLYASEKWDVIFIFSPLWVRCFSLWLLWNFFFVFDFLQLEHDLVLLTFTLPDGLSFLGLWFGV